MARASRASHAARSVGPVEPAPTFGMLSDVEHVLHRPAMYTGHECGVLETEALVYRDGEVRVAIDLNELNEASNKALVAANRMAIALVAAAVILASGIIGTFVTEGPQLFGLALIGVPGFVAGLVLFGWLVVGMIRSGNW